MSDEPVLRIQSVSLKRRSDQMVILWGASEKEIPPRPEDPAVWPEEDSRHWYDLEFAGWGVAKENIPESPRTGTAGKKIIYLQPGGGFAYMDRYVATLRNVAERTGIELQVLDAAWDRTRFDDNVRLSIKSDPDMILLNPENNDACTGWYQAINRAGIPVIGSNFLANSDSHRYLLAWTGPDDWGQTRLLARRMADRMGRQGGYAILQHLEGNSSFYARTWGVITELKTYAPGMKCLATAPGMDSEEAALAVKGWLSGFGRELGGLFCADDDEPMRAVADVLDEAGRDDIVCVAAGSSRTGLELIIRGRLDAAAYQSPEIDGEIAMQTAVDWFDGLPVEPIRYLPKHIVTADDAAEFLDMQPKVGSLDLERLYRCVRDLDWRGSYQFFGDLYLKFLESRVIPVEHLQGLCLEILTGLIGILRESGLSVEETLGDYDGLAKHLLRDTDVSSVLDWLNQLAQEVITRRIEKLDRRTPVQEIISYVEENIAEPVSLKTLSHRFGISQAYLGQMFRKQTGVKFNDYLNGMRIDRAKELLKGRQVVINTVAKEVGYANPDYFYKVFKRITGMSAGDYIKSIR